MHALLLCLFNNESQPQLGQYALCLLCHVIHPWPAGWVGL